MAEIIVAEQRCCRCGEIKPVAEFTIKKSKSNGLNGSCKDCNNARQRARYKAFPRFYPKPPRDETLDQISPARVGTFWGRVKVMPTGCWEWQGQKRRRGYGEFSIKAVNFIAHRVAYRIYYLTNPGNLAVLHRCDNPPCCNPLHLFLGTPADNIKDMCNKSRQARGRTHGVRRFPERCIKRGSEHKVAKLTEAQVIAIRERYATGGISQQQLASEYGISDVRISMIITRKAWTHI